MPTNRTRRVRTNQGSTPTWAHDLLVGRPVDPEHPEFNNWLLLARYQVSGLPLADSDEGRTLIATLKTICSP